MRRIRTEKQGFVKGGKGKRIREPKYLGELKKLLTREEKGIENVLKVKERKRRGELTKVGRFPMENR